jgi:hypothetical protein
MATFSTEVNFNMDVEYYNARFFSTIPIYERELLTHSEQNSITREQKISIEKTNKVLNIQKKIYKYEKNIFSVSKDLVCSFDEKNEHNIKIGSIKWGKKVEGRYNLPDIKITLQSSKPLDKLKLYEHIMFNGYIDDYYYNKGKTNGWTWYTLDSKCEYARTRIIGLMIENVV